MMVRNRSYPHHLTELLTGLFSDLDLWMVNTLGFHLSDLFAIGEKIKALGMDRLYERKEQVLAMEAELTDAVSRAR